MKSVPARIIASGPPGTEWFGGGVDRVAMTLRVMAKVRGESVDCEKVTRLLACEPDQRQFKHWSLDAPEKEEADLDSQVAWILSRVTGDLSVWRQVTDEYRVDLFCALYLDRWNRGVTLAPKTMAELGARGIEMGFDIYGPEDEPNQSPLRNASTAPASSKASSARRGRS